MPSANVDYLGCDSHYSEEERSFATPCAPSSTSGSCRSSHPPGRAPSPRARPADGELGLLGSTISGVRLRRPRQRRLRPRMQELERGDSGLRSLRSVQGSLVMYPIHTFGSEEQKERWLPKMAKGEIIGCFGLTEPDFGSNPGGMRTGARRAATSYVLNGTKRWITNGIVADVAVVWAKVDEGDPRLPGRERARGFSAPEHQGQGRCAPPSPAARLRGLPRPRGEHPARRRGPEGPAVVPDAGALRHRAGAPSARPWRASTAPSTTRRPRCS